MNALKMPALLFFAAIALWHPSAQAQAVVGKLTSAGIEMTDHGAYVVATIDQATICGECPRADQVFAAPLDSPFGQRLAVMVDQAIAQGRRVTIVLAGCDEAFYGRRRIVSFTVHACDRSNMGPGLFGAFG